MDLDALLSFVKTAQLGGTGPAANALRRPEVAVSNRIEVLEQQLGEVLFDRTQRRPPLTPVGKLLLPFAEAAVAALQEGSEALKLFKAQVRPTLEVAMVGTLSRVSVASAFRELHRRYPTLRLFVHRVSSADASNLVRDGRAELGLRYGVDNSPHLICRTLGYEDFQVVVSASHHLARRVGFPVDSLVNERWVACLGSHGAREIFIHAIAKRLKAAGLASAELTPVASIAAQKRFVEAGYGIGLMPLSSVANDLKRGTLVTLPVPALRIRIPISVVYRRRGMMPITAVRLLNLLTRRHQITPEAAVATNLLAAVPAPSAIDLPTPAEG
jgi:DNA-binding transcriptional LysR family regulator